LLVGFDIGNELRVPRISSFKAKITYFKEAPSLKKT
jgi:hypothetical protein